jgi:hypothetical protein
MVRIWLDGERPVSWNTFMRYHWRKQQDVVKHKKWLMRAALAETLSENPDDWPRFTDPVVITMTAYFKGLAQDASNLTIKLYEDGILTYLIDDDNPDWVDEVRLKSRRACGGQKPGVLIEIEKAGQV